MTCIAMKNMGFVFFICFILAVCPHTVWSDIHLQIRSLLYPDPIKNFDPLSSVSDYPTFDNNGSPSFDNASSQNVTAVIGRTAYLHCIVNNLGNNTVSWIRRSDMHVLSIGRKNYYKDRDHKRFEVLHVEETNDWLLKDVYSLPRDNGTYECQVDSDPKISLFVNLYVISPVKVDGMVLPTLQTPRILATESIMNFDHPSILDRTFDSHVIPSFDNTINVTAYNGKSAYLHCVVNNLEENTVSWIRRKDMQVLTVGLNSYIKDDRFKAVYVEEDNDWMLKMDYALLLRDDGLYECQVDSDPKTSRFVNLIVDNPPRPVWMQEAFLNFRSLHDPEPTENTKDIDPFLSASDYWTFDSHESLSFGNTSPETVVTELGQNAYLHCVVNNTGNNTVTWIKRMHYGYFPMNDRFETIHMEETNDWILKIKYAIPKDEAVYECQVDSDPKLSILVELRVEIPQWIIDLEPSFEDTSTKNVTTQLGKTVYLHCVVNKIGYHTVTWFREKDDQILTFGPNAFLNYDRFEGIYMEENNDWILKIERAQPEDEGLYECTVDTHPRISIFVELTVEIPPGSVWINETSIDFRSLRDPEPTENTKNIVPSLSVSDYLTFDLHPSPSFDNTSPENVVTRPGKTVYLHCVVNNLGNNLVAWKRKGTLLTLKKHTFTNDDRFEAIHWERKNDWVLKVKFAQLEDEGLYECQIFSDSRIRLFVNLSVVAATTEISGPDPLVVKTGSSINLTCTIMQNLYIPMLIFWYHDGITIQYGMSTTHPNRTKESAISTLFIKEALADDSGNYTCSPTGCESKSISVYVLNST